MKIIYHKDKTITIKLDDGRTTYKLASRKDLTEELTMYLKVFKVYERAIEHLLPHPDYENPVALRTALATAIGGDARLGREILGYESSPAYSISGVVITTASENELKIHAQGRVITLRKGQMLDGPLRCELYKVNPALLQLAAKFLHYERVEMLTRTGFLKRMQNDALNEGDAYAQLGAPEFKVTWDCPNHGTPWSQEDCKALKYAAFAFEKLALPILGRQLGRTALAVLCKAVSMDLEFDWIKTLETLR